MSPSAIKTMGYLISTLSVVLLGGITWKTASQERWTTLALLGGIGCSFLGMLLRWISYQREG